MRKIIVIIGICLIFAMLEVKVNSQEQQTENNGQAIYVNGSMGKLYALLQLPELAPGSKCPMVILSHGFGGNLDFHLWAPLAEILNSHGIGVLRFDFNGCGKSEGEFENMTVPNEIDDLLNVISYVRALPFTKSISLVGHSQGGVVSGMAAGQCGAIQIDNLVLLSAAAVLREDALRGQTMGLSYDPWHLDKPFYVLGSGEKLGREYIQTAMNLPIYETTANYKGNSLILNGMADQVVPYTYAQRYKQILPQAKLVLIPGENHRYAISPDWVVNLVADWLIKNINQKGIKD